MVSITFLLLVHDNPIQLLRLINRLSHTNVKFLIHVDAKSDITLFEKIIKESSNISYVENRVDVQWGDISMIKAVLSLLKCSSYKFSDYLILLSNNDYPIMKINDILSFITENKSKIFVNANPIPSPNIKWNMQGMPRIKGNKIQLNDKSIAIVLPYNLSLFNIKQLIKVIRYNPLKIGEYISSFFKQRTFPSYLKPYGGEFWFAIPSDVCQFLLNFTASHKDYMLYHMQTANPDEIFMQSIIYTMFPKERIINYTLRYINWDDSTKDKRSPTIITIEQKKLVKDLMLTKEILFIRKVDERVDFEIFDYIDNYLDNKIL